MGPISQEVYSTQPAQDLVQGGGVALTGLS